MAMTSSGRVKFEWRNRLLTFLRRQTWEAEKFISIRFLFHLFGKKLRDETVDFLFVVKRVMLIKWREEDEKLLMD